MIVGPLDAPGLSRVQFAQVEDPVRRIDDLHWPLLSAIAAPRSIVASVARAGTRPGIISLSDASAISPRDTGDRGFVNLRRMTRRGRQDTRRPRREGTTPSQCIAPNPGNGSVMAANHVGRNGRAETQGCLKVTASLTGSLAVTVTSRCS